MDISWKKDIKYINELNKKFLVNTSSNKNTNNIFFNSNNNINMTDISNNKKEIYTKNNINPFIEKDNDNFQSYHISYLKNPNNINHNPKGLKNHNTKIINNYYQSNQAFGNNNKKKERELSMSNKYKNDFNKHIENININNDLNNIIQNNEETTYFFDTNPNNLNNNGNIFANNNSIFISSQNTNKKNSNNNIILKNNNYAYYENIDISHNNNIKGKINYNAIKKKNSRSISGSYSQQNIIMNNKKLLKTEENYDDNNSGYLNNLNNINISNRNNYAFFISPNRFNNSNNINNKYKILSSINKSGKKEKIKYTYQTSIFDNNNTQNNNNNNESDFINNNYSNINIDLYGNNDTSMNNNNYINLYLMNNNKLLYYQNNQNIPKSNIKGNIYMLSKNNIKPQKNQENNEVLRDIKVNTTKLTRNNLLTERNNLNNTKNNNTNKSLENSDCLLNIKIKDNKNYINKIINRTNENNNIYNNKLSKTKIYKKKIDMKNNKPFLYQKDNNIKNIVTNNKNNNKKKENLKKQKNKKSNIILEKPQNKYCFKKKYYCHNIKIYEIKKCYLIKSYITKNIKKKQYNNGDTHEVTFTEKISVLIDNNNMNTISIHNNEQNQIEENSLIENSFKENNKPQNNNDKINSENINNYPQLPENNILKIKRNYQKLAKHNNSNINNLDKEELEMTFGIEEIYKNNNNNFKSQTNKEELDDEGDLYQNEDIKIMTDDEEQSEKEENNLRITQGKEIGNVIINPEKINKGLELLAKIQEKRIYNKFEKNLENNEENDNEELFDNNNDIDLYNYYKKTNTLKPKDSRMILKNLTKNKKCEILNDVLTELFTKKEKESKLFDTKINSLMNYNPNKIEKYEKIFNQEQIQNLEIILNKKKLDKMFDVLYDKEEIMNEIKSNKKNIMTYNKKYSKQISSKILEESYNEENTSIISDTYDINNPNKIIFSLEYILDINKNNEFCKKINILPQELLEHCNEILNNYEKENKKAHIPCINMEEKNDIEKWSRKDINPEIKKAEEYIKKMNIDMSKNNYKYEIIEILNILTVDNYTNIFNKLSDIVYQINNYRNIKPEILLDNQFRFSEIIIDKAIMEKGYVKLYAKICYDLHMIFIKKILNNQNSNNILQNGENLESLLISQCKQKINDYQYNKNNDIEEIDLIKKKFLGTINFVCELIDVKLFKQKIGIEFLDMLYNNYKNEFSEINYDERNKNLNLEGCINLLNKFGKIIFEEKNEKFLENLDYYMKECIIPIINNNNNDKNIPDYIKYKIINLIEKQKNNWEESMFEKSILAKGKNTE